MRKSKDGGQYTATDKRRYAQLKEIRGLERSASQKLETITRFISVLVEKGVLSDEDIELALPRKRSKVFVDELTRHRVGGADIKTASVEAVRAAFPGHMNRSIETCVKKAVEQLERPNVCLYAQARFEKAGLSEDYAFGILVAHVKGTAPKNASLQALTYALGLMLPKQTAKIEGQFAVGIGVGSGAPPAFAARKLVQAKVIESEDVS